MPTELEDFEHFLQQRDAIAEAYVNGDPSPLSAIVTPSNPATYFAPMGGILEGAANVEGRYTADAGSFGADGQSSLEVLQFSASGDLAYWTGLQHATVRFGGNPPMKMDLRITEIFRREKGEWKLIHRHADTLVDPPAKPS